MARRRRRRSAEDSLPTMELSPGLKRGILIVVFLVLAVISFLAFFDLAGAFGGLVIKVMNLLFGWGALVAPLIFFAIAVALFLAGRRVEDEEEEPVSNLRVYLGAIFLVVSITGGLHLIAIQQFPFTAFELVKDGSGGGYIGVLSALPLFRLLDFWPSLAILIGLFFISVIVLFNIHITDLFKRREREEVEYEEDEEGEAPRQAPVKINKLESSGFTATPVEEEDDGEVDEEMEEAEEEEEETDEADDPAPQTKVASKYRKGNWQLPPLSLLEDSHTTVDSGNIEANVTIIQNTLADFGIDVEMGEVNVGPTVTQYTLRPAQGIKLSQIIGLQNDLALALAAPSIRIEAPIPGKALVGIEIPNKATAIVRLKDIVGTESFSGHKSNLAFALGRDVAGHPMIGDITKMPHMLIAGATGTGKSVAINSLIISLLYRNSPEELRFIAIDPKRVELTLYNGIPHLLTPVIIDHTKAVNALKWAVNEMDRRYNLLSETGKRNIGEYNSKAEDQLPYIVVIVDELADLMSVAQADVESAIVRLAQMARAVGVHLVVATQRPSVDIITGLIKANITARAAFAVASQVDSRTILDVSGAEKLLGSGDMLYLTAELSKPKRVQGTYISEKEVRSVVKFVSEQAGEVEYTEGIVEKQRAAGGGSWDGDDEDDELLSDAIDAVKRAGKASASLLQRRLRIGYARAARLLDLMEDKGIIGPADGAKPREVYITEDGDDMEEEV